MSSLKKILLYTGAGLVLLMFSAWLFRELYNKAEEKKQKSVVYRLSNEEKKQLQDGDIILRYGHGLVSDYIANLLEEEFTITHCGIINKKDNHLSVIHSESSSYLSNEGIQQQDFDEFTDAGHPNSVIVVRYNRSNSQDLSPITRRAEYYLEKKLPFDYSFNPKDTTQMFCSEIIWHIFLDVFKDDIFRDSPKNSRNFKQFKNFWDSSRFDIIINHQETKKLKTP